MSTYQIAQTMKVMGFEVVRDFRGVYMQAKVGVSTYTIGIIGENDASCLPESWDDEVVMYVEHRFRTEISHGTMRDTQALLIDLLAAPE